MNDLAEGRIHAYVAAYAIERPQVANGKIKVLALTNPKRAQSLPDIPTARRSGLQISHHRWSYRPIRLAGNAGFITRAKRRRYTQNHRGPRDFGASHSYRAGTPQEFAAAIADQQGDRSANW